MRSLRSVIRGSAALVAVAALSLGPAATAHAEQRPAHAGTKAEQAKNDQAKTNQGSTQPGCDGSHHSATGHGANTDGADNPYHNTCDGSPSGNGNGKGEAKGRPAAGTVGNADDKNPPGQAPGPSDGNAGYECDRNHGIARSNPAHTGCRDTTTPPPAVLPAVSCPGGATMTTDVNGDGKVDATDCPKAVVPVVPTCPSGETMTSDVNGDGKVDAGDCVKPVTPVTCPGGITMTTDVNGDGKVDGADCVKPAAPVTCPGGIMATDVNGDGTVDRGDCAEVKGETLTRDEPLHPASVNGTRLTANRPTVAGTTLPLTGSNGGTLVALSLVLLAAGGALTACGITKPAAPAC